MLRPREFWHSLEDARPRILLVVQLDTWKQIGDEVGIEGVQLAEGVLTALCTHAMQGASTVGRIGAATCCATWARPGAEATATEVLGRWSPMVITAKGIEISIALWWASVELDDAAPAKVAFERTERILTQHVDSLPTDLRVKPLPYTWEELNA